MDSAAGPDIPGPPRQYSDGISGVGGVVGETRTDRMKCDCDVLNHKKRDMYLGDELEGRWLEGIPIGEGQVYLPYSTRVHGVRWSPDLTLSPSHVTHIYTDPRHRLRFQLSKFLPQAAGPLCHQSELEKRKNTEINSLNEIY